MKALIDKYYTFTLVFVILSVSLVMFKDNKDIVNMIVGGFLGLLTAPALIKNE